jgi:endonuclease III
MKKRHDRLVEAMPCDRAGTHDEIGALATQMALPARLSCYAKKFDVWHAYCFCWREIGAIMAKPSQRDLVKTVLDSYGQTYAIEVGIRLKNTPAPLFQLLNASLLLSARIAAENAVRAARALKDAKLTTSRKMAEASWQDRVDVLAWHGYKRYDESTSTMLGDTAKLLIESYDGDLRNLREEAEHDVEQERQLLQQFKGIGGVGADIFLREVQSVWDEAFPYADSRVTKAAKKLGLPTNPKSLSRLVSRTDFTRLVAGLVRVDLAHAQKKVQEQAASGN